MVPPLGPGPAPVASGLGQKLPRAGGLVLIQEVPLGVVLQHRAPPYASALLRWACHLPSLGTAALGGQGLL